MVENFKMKGISISKTTVQVKKKSGSQILVHRRPYTGIPGKYRGAAVYTAVYTAAPRYILQYIPRHSPAPRYIPVYHQSGTLPCCAQYQYSKNKSTFAILNFPDIAFANPKRKSKLHLQIQNFHRQHARAPARACTIGRIFGMTNDDERRQTMNHSTITKTGTGIELRSSSC